MDLLKTISAMPRAMNEDAAGGAVGGGAVAAFSTPLFASLVKRSITTTPVLSPYAKTTGKKDKPRKNKGLGIQEAFDDMGGMAGADGGMGGGTQSTTSTPISKNADTSGVIAKLKDLEHREKDDFRDTTTFGLEDEHGNLVRVVVKTEQAPQFEEALQTFLSQDTEDDRPLEVSEILFKLKDQFDIVDVVWPDVEEDEEEDTMMGGEQPMGDDMAGAEGEMPLGAEGEVPLGAEGEMPPVEPAADPASMLTQVLDMMKADAEARKADAEARKAEAKAKEADAVINQAMSKVKQEEQYLDMEAYNKAKKEEERETKRLAQLAKWKHDVAREGGDIGPEEPGFVDDSMDMPEQPMGQQQAPEEEERAYIRPAPKPKPVRRATTGARVSPGDVANFILNRVKR